MLTKQLLVVTLVVVVFGTTMVTQGYASECGPVGVDNSPGCEVIQVDPDNPDEAVNEDEQDNLNELRDRQQENEEENNEEIRESCRDQGYEDGPNGPFNRVTYNHCGDDNSGGDDAYYDGFIDGCMDVEGNTRDVCENATD